MAGRIQRVTMFKMPREEDMAKIIEEYKTVQKSAKKVRKNTHTHTHTYIYTHTCPIYPHTTSTRHELYMKNYMSETPSTFVSNIPLTQAPGMGGRTQDGKPYILSLSAGPSEDDARRQGYTFLAVSEFASLEDMRYYDEECPAHQALKDNLLGKVELGGPPLTVFFTPKVVGGRAAEAEA